MALLESLKGLPVYSVEGDGKNEGAGQRILKSTYIVDLI
jgi:hypothetical protein